MKIMPGIAIFSITIHDMDIILNSLNLYSRNSGMVMLPQMMCLCYSISILERVKSSNGSGGVN